jgi:hypothetical protein
MPDSLDENWIHQARNFGGFPHPRFSSEYAVSLTFLYYLLKKICVPVINVVTVELCLSYTTSETAPGRS